MTDQARPRVTFALFAYSQSKYVRVAAESALAQTYSPLEVILSDDCSTDETYDILRDVAARHTGPHRILLNRNASNQGIGGHINAVMRKATGDLVVVAAGDDISVPSRVARIVDAWDKADQRADLICSDFWEMSEAGDVLGVVHHTGFDSLTAQSIARDGNVVPGSTAAWTARLWRRFGDLPAGTVHEDQVIPFRAMLGGGILKLDEPLVRHRAGVSKWIQRGAADPRELQRRAGVVARNVHLNALTAREDALRAGRDDLLPMLAKRVRETELVHRIHNEELPPLAEVVRMMFSDTKRAPLLRAYLRRRLPFVHAAAVSAQRLRRRE